ncbi:diguanylate cyclase [Vallitaleaceae bacterium 9-2]
MGKKIIVILESLVSYLLYVIYRREKKIDEKWFDDLVMHHLKEGVALHELVYDENESAIDYRFLKVNDSFEKITGLLSEDILGKNATEVIPGLEESWIIQYVDVVQLNKEITFENYSEPLKKRFRVNVFSPYNNIFVTIFTDVTVEYEEKKRLEKEKALTFTTLDSLSDGVISSDINCNIEMMNAEAERLTGWKLKEAKGTRFCSVFSLYDPITKHQVECSIREVMVSRKTKKLNGFISLKTKDGKLLPIEYSIAPIISGEDALGAVVVFRDNTEKLERIEKIKFLSYHDQLTGVYNRHFYEEEIRRLDVERNLPFSILMIDVNGLKLTNDAFGHLAGDNLLKMVAKTLKSACRSDEIIARIGGDEFVILLPSADENSAAILMKRIYKSFENISIESVKVSVSIGWGTKVDIEESIDDIYVKAEEYMYRKKISESRSMRNSTIKAIMKTLYESNKAEARHSKEVARLVRLVGKAFKLGNQETSDLSLAGAMHDIGKIVISKSLLEKKEAITHEEYKELKRHVDVGYQILKSVEDYSELAGYVLSHHEKWDGSGYPNALKGEEIPLYSRIIAVADAYDVMTNREYGKKYEPEAAIDRLESLAGIKYDSVVVAKFVDLYKKGKVNEA